MSLGGVNPLNTSASFLMGGLRPDADSISRVTPIEDDSTAAIWVRLEDLRRQRGEVELDGQVLPPLIARLQAMLDVIGHGTEANHAALIDRLRQLQGGVSGLNLRFDDNDDLAALKQRIQDQLYPLQLRWFQGPARVADADREMQRLRARLQQRQVEYDVETGGLKYTHTGQSIDPTTLLTKLWDRMKESRKVEPRHEGKSDKDRTEAAAMTGLLALLASLSPDGKAPVAGAEGLGPQPLDPPDRQVRAYVMTQMVVNGGAGAPARVYQAKRSVFCDADEVTAGGMASYAVDSLTIGSRGLKEIDDPNRPRPEAGPAAFAALVA